MNAKLANCIRLTTVISMVIGLVLAAAQPTNTVLAAESGNEDAGGTGPQPTTTEVAQPETPGLGEGAGSGSNDAAGTGGGNDFQDPGTGEAGQGYGGGQDLVCWYHEAQGNSDSSWTKWMPESSLNGHNHHDGDGERPAEECGGEPEPENNPPVCRAEANPITGEAPLDVNYDGSGSYDPDGDALTFNWSFGATAAQASFTYQQAGTYIETLTVSDGELSASCSVNITVTEPGDDGDNEAIPAAPSGAGLDLLAVDRETGPNRRNIVIYFIDRATMAPVGEITTTLGLTGTHSNPSLSPNGEQVVWSRDFEDDETPAYLWIADLNGDNAEPIQFRGSDVLGYQPSWEPHGNRIAYVEPWGFDLRITDIENEYFWNLGVKGEYPTWSPDGEWLAFTSFEGDYLTIVSSSGRDFGYVETGQICITPRWSPDGQSIFCTISWDYPEVVEVSFTDFTATSVAEATWLSPDHYNTTWSAQQVVPDEGGAHLVIRNILTDEETYESTTDERNPDWWSANPVESTVDMTAFENWVESPAPFEVVGSVVPAGVPAE